MKPGDLVYWKQWEPGYTEPIPQIGLLLEDPIGLEDGNKVYKAKVLISQNSSKIATLFNVRLDVLNETRLEKLGDKMNSIRNVFKDSVG